MGTTPILRRFCSEDSAVHISHVPDVLLERTEDNLVECIIDAKYKPKAKRQDMEQMITFCSSTGSQQGLIVYPFIPGSTKGLSYRGKIGPQA